MENRPPFLLFLLLFVALLGFLLTRHYGESWDELKFYKYADLSLQAYTTWPTSGAVPEFGNTYDNYGPAYVMLVSLGARALGHLLPWELSDLRHLLYFFTFLAGVWAFHALAQRWLSLPAALGATCLFVSQPLFWGHAFISPKDIPFLSFFLLSLLFGLRLFDRPRPLLPPGLSPRSKRLLLVLTTLWLASVIGLFLGVGLIHAWLEDAVRAAAAGTPNLIARMASDLHKVAPEVYVQRYFTLFIQTRAIFFYLFTCLLGYLYRRLAPAAFHSLIAILFPALFLGIAVSIRILGPLAGLLIALYGLRRQGAKAVPILLIYTFFTLAVTYATWPYLWPDPLGHLIESLRVMSQYPWPGEVLFDGVQYASTDIPRSYLPVLLGIQLTEPVWALFIAGLAATGWGLVKRRGYVELLALTLFWFILPLSGFIVTRTPLYDNFRQVFFILPPVFLIAGVVFEGLPSPFGRGAGGEDLPSPSGRGAGGEGLPSPSGRGVRGEGHLPSPLGRGVRGEGIQHIWQIVLIVLAALPGLVGIYRLHPYEYIYYNSFVGGEQGAFRRFELDYWGVSYREAAAWLNENAPPQANVWVEGPAHLLHMYLRDDLNLYSTYEAERAEHYDFVVATSRYDLDLTSYPTAPIVHVIARSGAILTVVKQP